MIIFDGIKQLNKDLKAIRFKNEEGKVVEITVPNQIADFISLRLKEITKEVE